MVRARLGISFAAACCLFACGARPDPPGTASDGAGSAPGVAGGGAVSVSEPVQLLPDPPASDDPEPPEPEPLAADAGSSPRPDDGLEEDPAPAVGPGLVLTACTTNGGGCTVINVAVTDDDAESCIQIALDDCEASAQAGLPVDLPVSWRLGAASVGPLEDECLPGATYNPMTSTFIVDGTGTISWNLTSRQPSEFVFDVTLVPSSTARDTSPIPITSSDLVEPLPECDG